MNEPKHKKALETGSGITWDEWVKLLAPYRDLDHTDMAKITLDKIHERGKSKSPEWWAQGVTVAYEQYIGRRKVGQQSDGKFSVTVSKTLPGDMDEALATWLSQVDGVQEFDGIELRGMPRVNRTEKWRYWRVTLDDDSTISVNIQTKPSGDKSTLSINHDKLAQESDVERWRTYWKSY